MVTKLAKDDPRKLRQIAENYDIAHAKARVEPADSKKVADLTETAKENEQKGKEKEREKEKDKEKNGKAKARTLRNAEQEVRELLRKKWAEEDEAWRKLQDKNMEQEARELLRKKWAEEDEVWRKLQESWEQQEQQDGENGEHVQDNPSNTNEPTQSVDDKDKPGGEKKEEPPKSNDADNDNKATGKDLWNPVCVIGLRVYSKDPDVSISVVKPDNKAKTI